jgi:hypothetical protein
MFAGAMPSEYIKLQARAVPSTFVNVEKLTDAIAVADYHAFLFVLAIGDVAAETVDFRIEVADDSGFTTNKITLKAATQLAANASNNDSKELIIECRNEDLQRVSATALFVRGRAITGGATGGPMAIIGFGVYPRYGKGSNRASVLEVARP